MKHSALQLARQIVNDNKQYIDGNIAEYMILEVDSNDNNFYQYLTDEEIEEMNGNPEKWNELGEEVHAMLRENFDFDITEFEY
ncbi:hypothetical protein [Sunxiuqinia indica]|uniref:hypothetical protein n=1 Tax=Sunxiuqinia indica TaxID=2692584 RepID=UPI0013573226|nr:hypothetical protein [Sunxiuqinia indica]